MICKVIGICGPFEYTMKDGNRSSGVRLAVSYAGSRQWRGANTMVLFLNPSRFQDVPFEAIQPGDDVDILFNMYGKPDKIFIL